MRRPARRRGPLSEVAGPDDRYWAHAAPTRKVRIDHMISASLVCHHEHDLGGIRAGSRGEPADGLAINAARGDIHWMRVPVAEIPEA